MGELTSVGKNGRVYTRRFDWAEAQALYAAGASAKAIAVEFGVSQAAVHLAVNPKSRARQARYRQAWQRDAVCSVCGAPCSKNPRKGRPPRCAECAHKAAATSVRPDALQCVMCKKWLPDEEFPGNKHERQRRYKHSSCRTCQTIMRRASRERRKVPCDVCGGPRLPFSEKGRRHIDSGLCLSCYRDSIAVAKPTTWPKGILSRVSLEAYYAVTRARGFDLMTPAEREAAALAYDAL